MKQLSFFINTKVEEQVSGPRKYLGLLTVSENKKGVLDVDTVKGCTDGLLRYSGNGCYGECYACKTAKTYGIDFSSSVPRKLTEKNIISCFNTVKNHCNTWYRVGVAGDPSFDWDNTIDVISKLKAAKKIPVIVTKHWRVLSDSQLEKLSSLNVVFNTSVSGLDTDSEIKERFFQYSRIKQHGITSVCRVVTCDFGNTDFGRSCKEKQDYLLSTPNVIDNPFRVGKNNQMVISGDILITRKTKSIGGGSKFVSLHDNSIFLGHCNKCLDQCGIPNEDKFFNKQRIKMKPKQGLLFTPEVEYIPVKSVIGSGYEVIVAGLAISDGIAYRAARKNMQIHSAIILKIDSEVCGFFTFQINDIAKEFCLLQSTIRPDRFDFDIYSKMVLAAIAQNTNNYPVMITTDPKSKFETPKLFKSLGFKTYLKMSGFEYMVYGNEDDMRFKLLAHITMCNVWSSLKGDWLRLKKEWNEKIESAGEKFNIPNPKFASRDGCWQGSSGFSNVVLSTRTVENGEIIKDSSKSHNGNASVLDPVACEVILRFFMPTNGLRVYNPFGGGVQMGFVSGSYGYEYISSEIRQNQCDTNNAICQELNSAKWIKSDSSTYKPDGMFDLVFSCPPYYKVEKYIDYGGVIPEGEINNMPTYEEFRDTLFRGYEKAIEVLNDNCFFVVMTGDSRDKDGGYYCSESETELFFKNKGMMIYNKIIYLECEFTRLAQAKRTLNYRKFPKREQKIIVAFKGDPNKIKDLYPTVGRL